MLAGQVERVAGKRKNRPAPWGPDVRVMENLIMQNVGRILLLAAVSALAGGCMEMGQGPSAKKPAPAVEVEPVTPPNGNAPHLRSAVNTDEGGKAPETAVESAMAWMEKYSLAMEAQSKLQQENRQLADKNRQLGEEVVKLQGEFKQLEKELKEANAMLMEQRGELEKWRTNVLGFREEMRRAQEVELEALQKILKLLGAEAPARSKTPAR